MNEVVPPGLELCIFMPDGVTFYFYDVKILKDSARYIHFSYFGQLSGKTKKATFFYDRIAGISLEEEKK